MTQFNFSQKICNKNAYFKMENNSNISKKLVVERLSQLFLITSEDDTFSYLFSKDVRFCAIFKIVLSKINHFFKCILLGKRFSTSLLV